MIEDVEKHSHDIILTNYEDVEKAERSGLHKSTEIFHSEDGAEACHVVKSQKSKIKDKIPSHIGSAILQWSKLIFLR